MATTSTAMHLQPQRLRGAPAQRKRGASRERTVAPRARTAEQQSLKQREQYVRFEPWFLSHLFSVPLSSPTSSIEPPQFRVDKPLGCQVTQGPTGVKVDVRS
jgi:hypothetical protein